MDALRIIGWRFCPILIGAATLAGAPPAPAAGEFYQVHNLVSDQAGQADHRDANLVNAWGVAFNPFAVVWIADNGSGVSTLYDGAGNAASLTVQIPSPGDPQGGGNPTGVVYNGSNGFVVSNATASGPARFIFATEDGLIVGWAPNLEAPIATHAVRAVDNSATTGAVYKGLALSAGGGGSLLYAADFHNGRIDVFDSAFHSVALAPGAFTDPALPAGFAPFGLQAIGGNVFVSYALQNAARHDDVAGQGNGFVNVFDPNGNLIRRMVTRGRLNSPWGIALAPAGFGKFANRLLIGNFGDGRISACDIASGDFVGRLRGADHHPIQIDGLWGLQFGNGFAGQPVNTLFFAAGPFGEQHGLYGRIDLTPGDAKDEGTDTD